MARGKDNKKDSKKDLTKAYINQNPQDYFNLISDRAGLGTGAGVQPFHEWVRNSGYEQVARGYSDRLVHRPKLNFQKYMKNTYGIPTKKGKFDPQRGGQGGGPQGNAFTASSVGAMGNKGKGKGKKGKNGPSLTPGQSLGVAKNPAPFQDFATAMRQQFLRLTPEQAGTYNPAYSMGPSRWSVFG